MDIKDLRIFARVAAIQNLTAVAGALGLSAGTVSKRIQALEDELGVRLIDRTTRSSRLTDEGRTFLDRVERILAEIDLAQDEITAKTSQPAGPLAISAPACLARQLVQPALLGFAVAYPAIEVRVDITDAIANLHEGGYDAAIRLGALPDSTLKAKRLGPDRTVLVAAPAYIARRGAPQTPEEVAEHDCLVHGELRTWSFARDAARLSVRCCGRISSDSGDFLQAAALEGFGLLRTSEIAVRQDLAAGRLVRVLPDWDLSAESAIWAVYPNARHGLPRLRVLLDHLAEHCRTMLEDSTVPPAPAIDFKQASEVALRRAVGA